MLRRLVMLALAVGLAGATVFYARQWIENRRQAAGPELAAREDPAPRRRVLVAAHPLEVGTLLRPGSLRWQEWPDVELPEAYIEAGELDPGELTGAVVRRMVATGQPITPEDVVQPGERGFLAAVLDPGMRAVTVPVDEATAHGGLVMPGDRVDVILTQEISSEEGEERRVGETVLRDLRVVAVGRRLAPAGEGGPELKAKVRTVTLEVGPGDARRLAVAARLGHLTLALRALARPEQQAAGAMQAPPTWDTDVSRARRLERPIQVYRGPESETMQAVVVNPEQTP